LPVEKDAQARGYGEALHRAEYIIKLKGPCDIAVERQKDGRWMLSADLWQGHVEREIGLKFGRLRQFARRGVVQQDKIPARQVRPHVAEKEGSVPNRHVPRQRCGSGTRFEPAGTTARLSSTRGANGAASGAGAHPAESGVSSRTLGSGML
jgi:hypothetical protein